MFLQTEAAGRRRDWARHTQRARGAQERVVGVGGGGAPSASPRRRLKSSAADELWSESADFFEKARAYEGRGECEGAYFNYMLCGMALLILALLGLNVVLCWDVS